MTSLFSDMSAQHNLGDAACREAGGSWFFPLIVITNLNPVSSPEDGRIKISKIIMASMRNSRVKAPSQGVTGLIGRTTPLLVLLSLFTLLATLFYSGRPNAVVPITVSAINRTNGDVVFKIANLQSRSIRFWATSEVEVKKNKLWVKSSCITPFPLGDIEGFTNQIILRDIPADASNMRFSFHYAMVPNRLQLLFFRAFSPIGIERPFLPKDKVLMVESKFDDQIP
jgi:hypothetical protein